MGIPSNLTPMLSQYLEMKRENPDSILFYRMGDFYEMFFDDAVTAAPILDVQLTARDKNAAEPIPMCGVPHHSALGYIQKLLAAGHKVALCEQIEDPASAKGLVKRAVVRVMTPALVADPELVQEDQTYSLLAIHDDGVGTLGLCLLDLLDGRLRTGTAETSSLGEVLGRYSPREILVAAHSEWMTKLSGRSLITLRPDYFRPGEPVEGAWTALSLYLRETQKTEVPIGLGDALPLFASDRLALDSVSLAALEVLRPSHEGGKSLADAMDETVTAMGRRLLRDRLSQPSRNAEVIERRLDCVQTLLEQPGTADSLRGLLSPMRDLERLSTKTALGLASPRDLTSIREILVRLPDLQTRLHGTGCPALKAVSENLDLLRELTRHLEEALEDQCPTVYRDGGIFRSTFHEAIAEYRALAFDAKSTIAAMEERERTRSGIPSLKIKFNKVFGYTIEVTNTHLSRVPADYIRKQTISTGERFITEELKSFEEKVISAEHRLKTLEETLFLELRQKVAAVAPALARNAQTLAEIDVLQSFARCARNRDYRRPGFTDGSTLSIRDGRHPVVEMLLPAGTYVPNSLHFGADVRTWIITGPNMGGKSTIMRQVALISILAQAGSFVPASSADLPLLDAIFTRIGSSDDLSRGASTFMVEMKEVARILKTATPNSLIIIDEIGRGTSTYDGLALAWSLLEHLHNVVKGKTLFATHFHEVTALETILPGLANANVLVKKWKEEVVFLYQLAPGVCSRSYGIEVAKLAGIPPEVLSRARDIQGVLETQSQRGSRARSGALETHTNQLDFFCLPEASEKPVPLET